MQILVLINFLILECALSAKITAQINAVKRDSTIDRKTKGAILEPLEYYQKMIKRQMINMVDQEINDGLLD